MKVFVTGASGFVGGHVVKELVAGGHELVALSRSPESHPWLTSQRGVTSIQGSHGDLANLVDSIAGCDALVHLALIWPGEDVWDGVDDLSDIEGTWRLFGAAVQAGVRQIIYASSTAVHRPFQGLMSEESALTGDSHYAATKISGEALLASICRQKGISGTALRIGPVVGAPAWPGGVHHSYSVLAGILASAQRGEPITLPRAKGRQLIAARDVALSISAILRSPRDYEALVCCDETETDWMAVAQHAREAFGSRSIVVAPEEYELPYRFSTRRLMETTGLRPDSSDALSEEIGYVKNSSSTG